MKFAGKTRKAHRVIAYLVEGRDLDALGETRHSCNIKRCVNPEHTKLGTTKENKQDWIAARLVCKRGHDMTDPDNIVTEKKYGARRCKKCLRANQKIHTDKVRRLRKQFGI